MPEAVMENPPPQSSDQEDIVWWLRQAVKISGLSPGALAKKAGISPTTLTRLIYGRASHLPSWRTLIKIAAAANIPPPADDVAQNRAKDLFRRLLTEEQRRELDREGYVTVHRGEYRYRLGPRYHTEVIVLDQSDHPIESWCAYLPNMPMYNTYVGQLLTLRSDPAKLRRDARVTSMVTRPVAESTSSDVADEETKVTLPIQHTMEGFSKLYHLVAPLIEARSIIMTAAESHGPGFKAACSKLDEVTHVLWETYHEVAMAMGYPLPQPDNPSRRKQTVPEADAELEPHRPPRNPHQAS
jgi:transcriptional regulator with XRE-family HTH domain